MPAPCLYINFSRGWGGLEMFSASLFQWMSERGCPIIFIVRAGTRLHEKLRASAYSARVIPLHTLPYCDPRTLLKIRRIARTAGVKIVHTFKSSDISFAVLSTLSLRDPRARRVHHLQMLPKHSRRDPLHGFIYRRLDLLLTITNQIAERTRSLWPVRPQIVRTLYYGIDAERYRPLGWHKRELRRAFGLPDASPLIGVVGQVCEIKGQLLVLEAFTRLRARFPHAALVIAGSPAPGSEAYVARINQFIATEELNGAVTMFGFCRDIAGLLGALDLFVLGSKAEPFGLVMLEALAAQVLVVASNAGGVPEIIVDGENGLLYRADDERSLTDVLARACMLEPSERRRLIAAGVRTVQEKFSLGRFLAEMSEVYGLLEVVG